jgi:selenide,water dikinase
LCGLPLVHHPNLMVGLENADDAGVYKLSDELAIIQTIDFFTPIVDDPRLFGQIAVANALSDVYAMGGKPLTAMNVVCFPIKSMDISVLREILTGGLDKMREAGVVLVGGHSVEDDELKYGLSVTGTVHPERLITKSGARPGDKLVLTKPLGTGIINTALKGGMAKQETVDEAIGYMVALNSRASELMQETGANACTDVTGFGLLGHACEMAENSGVGIKISVASVPIMAEATELASIGMVPGGTHRNSEFRWGMIEFTAEVPAPMQDILFDPQTSGGLLISLASDRADLLVASLHRAGIAEAAVIGEVTEQPKGKVILK